MAKADEMEDIPEARFDENSFDSFSMFFRLVPCFVFPTFVLLKSFKDFIISFFASSMESLMDFDFSPNAVAAPVILLFISTRFLLIIAAFDSKQVPMELMGVKRSFMVGTGILDY